MFNSRHALPVSLCLCVLLGACVKSSKQSDPVNLYAFPPTQAQPYAHPVVIDNDSYYSSPMMYKGCASISEAPSCGGG